MESNEKTELVERVQGLDYENSMLRERDVTREKVV